MATRTTMLRCPPGTWSASGLGIWTFGLMGVDGLYQCQQFSTIATHFIPMSLMSKILYWWDSVVVDAIHDAIKDYSGHDKAGSKVEKHCLPISYLRHMLTPVFQHIYKLHISSHFFNGATQEWHIVHSTLRGGIVNMWKESGYSTSQQIDDAFSLHHGHPDGRSGRHSVGLNANPAIINHYSHQLTAIDTNIIHF